MGWVFRIATVLVIFLFASGCGYSPVANVEPAVGQVYALPNAATTLYALKTLAGASNGFVVTDGVSRAIFFWPLGEGRGVAFWGFDIKTARMLMQQSDFLEILATKGGQIGNCLETSCFADWLKNNGWSVVSGTALKASLRAAILEYLSMPARTLPTFIIMPAGMLEDSLNQLYPEPIQE